MTLLSDLLLIAGGVWCLLAAAGVLKLGDVYSRLHAGTKATTLGLVLVIAGAAIRLDGGSATKLVLAGLLVLLTAPVGAHLIGRAVHRAIAEIRIDTVDELADAENRQQQDRRDGG